MDDLGILIMVIIVASVTFVAGFALSFTVFISTAEVGEYVNFKRSRQHPFSNYECYIADKNIIDNNTIVLTLKQRSEV